MANPISNEKRKDIIKHMQAGASKEDVAKWLFISKISVTRIWDKFQVSGSYKPEPLNRGRKPGVSQEVMEKIVAKVKKQPDMTLLEIIEEFELKITQSALCRRLIKRGLRYKKRQFFLTVKNEMM
jgi:transposase